MEYTLPNSKDERSITQFLKEYFLNEEHEVILAQDLFLTNYDEWLEMILNSYALKVCKEHGAERVLLGCHSNNVASSTVIKKCGGVLVNTIIESATITNCYYEILV